MHRYSRSPWRSLRWRGRRPLPNGDRGRSTPARRRFTKPGRCFTSWPTIRILTERTKSALANDPITRNQPIIVSADNGIVILQGRVPHLVADRAQVLAEQVEGSRGVKN